MLSLKSAIILTIFLTLISKIAMSYNPNSKNREVNQAMKANPSLSELQKYVVFENGTERAFDNEYWSNKKEGIYVDVVNGKALFSSKNKYDSGTGWPSFTKPINGNAIVAKDDSAYGMSRTEVRAGDTDIHLGHVFDDGPKDQGGKRYCINSAALRFISKEDLKKEGYGEYSYLFD